MENHNGTEIPMGFGLALEQYNAMGYFLSLSKDTQQRIIDRVHTIRSKSEMADYVQSIAKNNK